MRDMRGTMGQVLFSEARYYARELKAKSGEIFSGLILGGFVIALPVIGAFLASL